jgi:hypothetical protein
MEPITHECNTNNPEWNESYYFVFYDNEQKLGGMSRIGFKPNKPEGMTFLFLFLPDGSAAGYHQTNNVKNYSQSLRVGGMSHEYQPDGIWNYKFKGKMIIVENPEHLPKVREQPKLIADVQKVKMNLNFHPISNVYEYSENMTPESLHLGKKAGDKHWEQIAKIFGEIQIGEKNYTILNTLGQRDHTHGIRDWTGVGNWLYYVVWFNENLAINPAAIIAEDGRLSTGGFIFKDGKNIPLKIIRILDQKFRKDKIFPVSSELELVDKLNEKHILKACVGPIIPVPFQDNDGNQSILIQSFADYELDNITGGFGSFETLRKVEKE